MRRLSLAALAVLTALVPVSCGMPPHSDSAALEPALWRDFPELAEWGQVVLIGGREYWSPEARFFVAAAIPVRHGPPGLVWAPYTNGAFYDDAVDGLVWVSFDPWGFITEHYGYWRHHAQFGYVWRPFYPVRWYPFVASVFPGLEGHVLAVCPFSTLVWEAGLYDAGFGFDDDYWAPYWSAVHEPGFYVRHDAELAIGRATVSFHDASHAQHPAFDASWQRDRRDRDRRGQGADREAPPRQEPPSDASAPPAPLTVEERLPARPATTAPRPDAGSEPPAASGTLPTIPARDLEVKRPQPEPAPRPALETKDLHIATPPRPARAESTAAGVTPPRPARAESTAAPRPAQPAPAVARPASPPAHAESTASQPARAESTAAHAESTTARGASAKKAIEARVKSKK